MSTQAERDDAARFYNPTVNGYRLDADPRCLWGWGPPERGCTCRFGHGCFRALGHPGECWDGGDPPPPMSERRPCDTARRPKDWDSRGRAEANR